MVAPFDPAIIDRAILAAPVRTLLGRDTVDILQWRYETLQGGLSTTGSLYHFTGRADDHGEMLSWSLVLKVLHSAGDDTDPTGPTYWKREALVYESGLLAALPSGLTAPRCLAISEVSDERAWLWLEEVTDTCGPRWPLSCYGIAAYHLGTFSGTFRGEHALPAVPWVSRGYLASTLARFPVDGDALVRSLEHPFVRRVCPTHLAPRLLHLLADREAFLATLDRLPQIFCHHDAWRRNLFVRYDRERHEQTVMIDWADAGSGVLGQDLAQFVFAPVHFCDLAAAALPALEDLAWSRYLTGLEDVGWTGDPAVVRLGYTTAVALRGSMLASQCVTGYGDKRQYAFFERVFAHPMEEIVEAQALLLPFLLDRADEARRLMGSV